MKKLINPQTNEVAYLDLATNTIYFSNSKTSHNVSIQNNPDTHLPQKLTVFADPLPAPVPKAASITSEPSAQITSEPKQANTSEPNANVQNDTPAINVPHVPNTTIASTINHFNTPFILMPAIPITQPTPQISQAA